MNNINSNPETIKEGITNITKNYGYENINVEVKSQFGDNTLAMLVLVNGRSMVPTLKDGEKIIIQKTKDAKVGDIVVAKDDEYGLIIKRLSKINKNQVYLTSDNKNETIIQNGVAIRFVGIKKWTNTSNIIGVAKIFNVTTTR